MINIVPAGNQNIYRDTAAQHAISVDKMRSVLKLVTSRILEQHDAGPGHLWTGKITGPRKDPFLCDKIDADDLDHIGRTAGRREGVSTGKSRSVASHYK